MPEILSQSEIDKLLGELSSTDTEGTQTEFRGETDSNIKEYDFRSPKRINKDQQKMLMSIHENFSRHLASFLSGILRTYCEIEVLSIEELPYFEYNNALPDSMITGVYNLYPIDGSVLIDFSNNITFALLERLLGGELENETIASREFTEIDISILERIMKRIANFMKDAWSGYLDVDASLQQLETNTRLIQALGMDEIVVIITMNVSIKSIKGDLTCCIPCINLETVLDRLTNTHSNAKRDIDNEQSAKIKKQIMNNINNSCIEVRGILGNAALTIDEVLNLHEGDVIKLDKRIDNNVDIMVNDNKWFEGIPGTKHNKKALKINNIVQERDTDK